VKEVGEAWTRWWRRSMVPTTVLRCGGEGRVDGAVPGCFNVEEERGTDVEEQWGTDVEVHAEDTVETDAEEERAPMGVWRGNERVRI
jgi:hypothetical protein